MRRLLLVGVFIEVALLIVGLTWVTPRSNAGGAPVSQAAAPTAFRIYGEGTGNVVNVNLTATETVQTIAENVKYHVWTFNGTTPAPVIRVHLGDTIHFTLTNASTINMAHSIDFHAAQTAWDVNYQPVNPGETKTFDWVARFPGVFMYHCGVPPVLMHISNGMYGAIIVEPKDALPAAREYVLVSSEFYPGAKPVHGVYEGDLNAMLSGHPTYVVFNGVYNQYQSAPLVAKPNELIRLWVMNAGPTLTTAFHVICALFDHVYPDGNPTNVMNGIQTYNVAPGAGAMFEMRIPDAGLYPFVTHSFAYTGLGAVGVIKIDPNAPAAPSSYPLMGNPFTGGVTAAKPLSPSGGGTVTSPTPTQTATPTQSPTGHGKATTVSMTASLANGFDPKTFDVKEGDVTITITNTEPVPHNFTIDALHVAIQLPPSATVTETFSATPAGIYEFYCSIPGHKEAGMVGAMTVTPAMAH